MRKKLRRKLPDVLTESERLRLLKVPNKRYPTGLRNYCMMATMLDCGLRSSEICNLRMNDLNLTTGEIKVVNGKYGVDRILWINGDSLKSLRSWIQIRPVDSEFVFCSLQGKQINTSYLRVYIAKCGQKAGIKFRVHPHTLRHTFGTDLYRTTKDIRLVQESLGHANISTTQIYTHIVNDELEKSMKGFRNKERKEKEALEKIKELEQKSKEIENQIRELKGSIDKDSLFFKK